MANRTTWNHLSVTDKDGWCYIHFVPEFVREAGMLDKRYQVWQWFNAIELRESEEGRVVFAAGSHGERQRICFSVSGHERRHPAPMEPERRADGTIFIPVPPNYFAHPDIELAPYGTGPGYQVPIKNRRKKNNKPDTSSWRIELAKIFREIADQLKTRERKK